LYGQKLRDQVEERLKFYETGAAPRKNIDVMEEVARHLKAGQDAMDEDEEAKKKKKKDKKASKKRKADDDEDDAAEDEQVIPCDQNIIVWLLPHLMYSMQSFRSKRSLQKR
jgi:nucleolar protein 56